MSGDDTGKMSKAEPRTDWQRLRAMTDEEAHAAIRTDPNIEPTDEDFWKSARVVGPKSGTKAVAGAPQQDIENYLAVRKWYRDRVKQGKATDADLKKLEQCRDLAIAARRAGVTTPAFD